MLQQNGHILQATFSKDLFDAKYGMSTKIVFKFVFIGQYFNTGVGRGLRRWAVYQITDSIYLGQICPVNGPVTGTKPYPESKTDDLTSVGFCGTHRR